MAETIVQVVKKNRKARGLPVPCLHGRSGGERRYSHAKAILSGVLPAAGGLGNRQGVIGKGCVGVQGLGQKAG